MNETTTPLGAGAPGGDEIPATVEVSAPDELWVREVLAAEPLPTIPDAVTSAVLAALAVEQDRREVGDFHPDADTRELEDDLDDGTLPDPASARSWVHRRLEAGDGAEG